MEKTGPILVPMPKWKQSPRKTAFLSAVRLVFDSKPRERRRYRPSAEIFWTENPEQHNMQFMWTSVLRHVRVRNFLLPRSSMEDLRPFHRPSSYMYASTSTNSDHIMAQVIQLVKKYDRLDASKVTETADFQKDLCLDSLDRVELVMALEQEFSIEIPEDKADKLTCCADVVNYMLTETNCKNAESS